MVNKLQRQIDNLFESKFGTWEYIPSEDKEELLYDFYVIAMLPIPQDEDLAYVLKDTKEKMFAYMKEHMLDATFFAVCCEFQHIDENDDEVIYKFYKKIGGQTAVNFIQQYLRIRQKGRVHKAVGARQWLLKDNPRGEGDYVHRYKSVLAAITRSGIDKPTFMEYARRSFHDLYWAAGYGGNAWRDIAAGWQQLFYATDNDSIMVAIDHIYDLEHNNDTIFDKVVAYYKEDSHYRWIQRALTHKRYIKDLHALIPMISSDLARFANAVIADNARIGTPTNPPKGSSLQSYQENLPGKKYQIGDKVEVTNDDDHDDRYSEQVGTVSGFTELKSGIGYMVSMRDGNTIPFKKSKLRLIQSAKNAKLSPEFRVGDHIYITLKHEAGAQTQAEIQKLYANAAQVETMDGDILRVNYKNMIKIGANR